MELFLTILILVGLCLAGGFWGVDSRPLDLERPPRRVTTVWRS